MRYNLTARAPILMLNVDVDALFTSMAYGSMLYAMIGLSLAHLAGKREYRKAMLPALEEAAA
jgi:hypothetical protein